VGTRSIEKSEKISGMLRHKGVPHQVLNAKYHEMEAEIIGLCGSIEQYSRANNVLKALSPEYMASVSLPEFQNEYRSAFVIKDKTGKVVIDDAGNEKIDYSKLLTDTDSPPELSHMAVDDVLAMLVARIDRVNEELEAIKKESAEQKTGEKK
jgi:hypothetical protein